MVLVVTWKTLLVWANDQPRGGAQLQDCEPLGR